MSTAEEAVPQAPQEDGAPEAQQPASGPADGEEGAPVAMSKSQMKKLRKRQFYEERKVQRKAEEKARKQADQERRREEGRQRLAAMTEEQAAAYREERNARSAARKAERVQGKAKMDQALEGGQRICVDLDFAPLMHDSELKSICKQLGYAWHANCGAAQPAHLVLTSLQGTMAEYMGRQVSGYRNWKATLTEQPYIEHFADSKEQLVYLTADSENELTELDPQAVYIIGGIVDRNRHKMLCFNKAQDQGIAHARLPIGDYMQLASSTVMTTNHVVEIMLKWLELRDWKAAFEAVIPSRKRKHENGEQQQQQGQGHDSPAAASGGEEQAQAQQAGQPVAEQQAASGGGAAAQNGGQQQDQQQQQQRDPAAAEYSD